MSASSSCAIRDFGAGMLLEAELIVFDDEASGLGWNDELVVLSLADLNLLLSNPCCHGNSSWTDLGLGAGLG